MDSALNSIKGLFESFVLLFTSVFSFLPPWCGLFIVSAFFFAIGVFVYRLIRG